MSNEQKARDAFNRWLDTPVAAGDDPAPWLSALAEEAAWQAWKYRDNEVAQLRMELAEAVAALPQAVRNERERCARIALNHFVVMQGGEYSWGDAEAIARKIRQAPAE